MNTIEDRTKEIENVFGDLLKDLKKGRQEKYEGRIHRRSDEDNNPADWSKENVSINWIRIRLLQNYGVVSFSTSYLNSYYDGVYNQEYSISLPWVCDSIEEFDLLFSKLKEMIEKLATNDSEHLFAPAICLELDAYVGDDEKFGVAIAKNKGYEEYIQSLRDFYADIINDRKEFDDIEYFNFESILWGLQRFIDEFGYEELKQFVTKIYDSSRGFDGGSIRHKMHVFLFQLCYRILYKTRRKLNEEEQDIFNFSGRYLLIEGDSYYGKQLYSISADCGNKVAIEKLDKKKKKKKEKPFATYKDDNVSLEAHMSDLQRYVKFVVKNENEAAYHKMVTFLTDIINNGFTPDYKLDFKSSIKNYLEIEDIGDKQIKNSMSQFWNNSTQYPAIHNYILEYVKAATSKGGDEYQYDDGMAEDEYTHPGGYAAAALALSDPSGKYLEEALGEFIGSVDIEYCSWPYQVGKAFYKKWGLTEESLPGVALCLASELISDGDAKELSENEELLNYMRKNNMHMGIMD